MRAALLLTATTVVANAGFVALGRRHATRDGHFTGVSKSPARVRAPNPAHQLWLLQQSTLQLKAQQNAARATR